MTECFRKSLPNFSYEFQRSVYLLFSPSIEGFVVIIPTLYLTSLSLVIPIQHRDPNQSVPMLEVYNNRS